MKKISNNKGISLLEVVIVVAIIGIMTGGAAMTYHVVNSRKPSSCISSIDSCLEVIKSEAMSKETQPYFVIYRSSDENYPGYYVAKTTSLAPYTENPQNDTKVGSKEISVNVALSDNTVIDVAENQVFITFERASGEIKSCYAVENTVLAEKSIPERITVRAGGRESTIRIIAETGKHFIE